MTNSNTKISKQMSGEFLREYITDELNLNFFKKVISSQGYQIIEFTASDENKRFRNLVDFLGIATYIKSRKAFIYHDELYRFLFLRSDLSESEKIILLAHEEGHIYCGHMKNQTISGQDINDEFEANEFAHYILRHKEQRPSPPHPKAPNKKTIAASLVLIFILFCGILIPREIQSSKYYGEYYATSSGEKYHKKTCYYIKNKTNVKRLTKTDFEKKLYTPCKVCLPELNE